MPGWARQERDRTQSLHEAVVDRLREINLLKDYGGYVTETISPVELGEKSWPQIPLLLVLGCLGGLMVGSGFAVIAEFTAGISSAMSSASLDTGPDRMLGSAIATRKIRTVAMMSKP